MAKYKAPENYKYDTKSGQYYRELQTHDNQGKPVHHVIWFDTETGEYTQKSYYASVPNKPGHKSLLFIVFLLVVSGGIFLYSNSSSIIRNIITPEELIESVGITYENNKVISFQDYDALLNDTGVVELSGETQIFSEDE